MRVLSQLSTRQTCLESRPFQQAAKILAVSVGAVRLRQRLKLGGINETKLERYLFRTGNLQSLALLNGLNEGRSLQKRVMRARIEPCHAAAKDFCRKPATLKIPAVHIGDLQLASRRKASVARQLPPLPDHKSTVPSPRSGTWALWAFPRCLTPCLLRSNSITP